MTNYSRSVLKSNGLHRSKNLPVKFGFSPRTVPANIAKKLPSQLPTQSVFQLLSQTAHVCFHRRKRVHTRLSEKDRTQGHTRRNRGCFGWGRYHYPRYEPHVHEYPRAGYQNGELCRFCGLVVGAPKERREPRDSDALMRVAVPRRRGPAGLRDLFATW